MKNTALFLVLAAALPSFALAECPDLTGVFDCKKDEPQYGALFLRIQQEETPEGSTRYTYEYRFKRDGKRLALTFMADANGVYNPDTKIYGVCRDQGFYTSKSPTDLSNAARNEILPDGNYQSARVTAGSEPFLCERIF